MPYAVLLTADAARDLENIYQYIAVHDALFFRLLDPRHVGTVLRCRDCSPNSPKRKAARPGTAPYSLGASERFETVPYRLLYKLPEEVDIVGTVPRTVRKAARSGTAPYSHDASERLGTVP